MASNIYKTNTNDLSLSSECDRERETLPPQARAYTNCSEIKHLTFIWALPSLTYTANTPSYLLLNFRSMVVSVGGCISHLGFHLRFPFWVSLFYRHLTSSLCSHSVIWRIIIAIPWKWHKVVDFSKAKLFLPMAIFSYLCLVCAGLTFICCIVFCHLVTFGLQCGAYLNHLVAKLEGIWKVLTIISLCTVVPHTFLTKDECPVPQ